MKSILVYFETLEADEVIVKTVNDKLVERLVLTKR